MAMKSKRGRGRPPTARAEIEHIIRESWVMRGRAPTRQEIVEVRDGDRYGHRTRKAVSYLIQQGSLSEDGGRVFIARPLAQGAIPAPVEAGG